MYNLVQKFNSMIKWDPENKGNEQ